MVTQGPAVIWAEDEAVRLGHLSVLTNTAGIVLRHGCNDLS